MRLKFHFGNEPRNCHGTEKKGERWNGEPVLGPKFRMVDLLGPIVEMGVITRAVWYKRLIFYFPTGAWWHIDIAIMRPR